MTLHTGTTLEAPVDDQCKLSPVKLRWVDLAELNNGWGWHGPPAAIQYILQRRKGSQWHGYSYHTNWWGIQKYHSYLGVPDASPCMLKHERTTTSEAQGAVWESHLEAR